MNWIQLNQNRVQLGTFVKTLMNVQVHKGGELTGQKRMHLREIRWERADRIHLAQDMEKWRALAYSV